MKQKYFEIGQIVNTFGIKGMLKVNPFTDDTSKFEKIDSILVDKKGNLLEMQIEEVKYSKNQLVTRVFPWLNLLSLLLLWQSWSVLWHLSY